MFVTALLGTAFAVGLVAWLVCEIAFVPDDPNEKDHGGENKAGKA